MRNRKTSKSRERHVSLKMILSLTVCLVLLLSLTSCYETDMTLTTSEENPPTFRLSGSGNLNFFLVMEVPEKNQRQTVQRSSEGNVVIWKILPNSKNDSIRELPPITYGKLPEGFSQMIPTQGSPPPLIEGKIYEVGGTAYNANGGFIWITIRDGKVVELPLPDSR